MATKFSHLVRIALVATLTALPAAAFGQVTAEMSASKVVVQDQKEVMNSAQQARPGDVIEYSVVYRNHDKSTAKTVMATLPVPHGMEFLPKTASPAQLTASTDGVHFAALPLMRKVKKADGTMQEQMVPYSEYRFLRWSLGDMAAGSSKNVSARMRIVDVAPVMAAKK
jgi:uncharacterized repeat protein (TIGR01451 family)